MGNRDHGVWSSGDLVCHILRGKSLAFETKNYFLTTVSGIQSQVSDQKMNLEKTDPFQQVRHRTAVPSPSQRQEHLSEVKALYLPLAP